MRLNNRSGKSCWMQKMRLVSHACVSLVEQLVFPEKWIVLIVGYSCYNNTTGFIHHSFRCSWRYNSLLVELIVTSGPSRWTGLCRWWISLTQRQWVALVWSDNSTLCQLHRLLFLSAKRISDGSLQLAVTNKWYSWILKKLQKRVFNYN